MYCHINHRRIITNAFHFYFPANKNVADANGRKGFGIGVAIADKPEGPYIPLAEPIKGVNGIDPNVFIDKDGVQSGRLHQP